MRHFFSTRIKVVLILALLVTVGLVVASNLTGMNLPSVMVQSVLKPIRAGANALTNQAEDIYDYIFHYEALKAENEALREEIAKMREESNQAGFIIRENERLRDLLDLKQVQEDFQLVDSYIITRSSTDWNSTFTLDKGRRDGIGVGMVAITANNEVVGMVTEVGRNYSVVKTILDSSLEISGIIASNGYSGMVQGGYSTGAEGLLRMNYLPSAAVIRNYDQVVTSGSTVYPRNLILGYVVDAGLSDSGVAKYAILDPAADIDNLEQVFVLTGYDQE